VLRRAVDFPSFMVLGACGIALLISPGYAWIGSQRGIRSNCRQRLRPIPNDGPDRCIALLPLKISSRMLDPDRRRVWQHSISNGARVLRCAGCAIHVGLDFGELNPPDWAALLGHDHDLEDQPAFGVQALIFLAYRVHFRFLPDLECAAAICSHRGGGPNSHF
jgi:hypothetical protein